MKGAMPTEPRRAKARSTIFCNFLLRMSCKTMDD